MMGLPQLRGHLDLTVKAMMHKMAEVSLNCDGTGTSCYEFLLMD
jgi:hypothetical protein